MQTDFKTILDEMRAHGMPVPLSKNLIKIECSEQIFKNAFAYFLSLQETAFVWRDEYKKVSEWLSDNKGRGLLLYGDCGLGKSMLGRYVIPAILLKYCRKVITVYNVEDINSRLDDVLSKKLLAIDDIGTEEMINDFGNKRFAFPEIMDSVEKESKLIIVSTNLDAEGIEKKYGTRVMDRIMSTMYRVKFTGKSLRK